MTRSAWRVVAAVGLVITAAVPATAADKAQQQLMAEIRMLQEQQQQLQLVLGGLAETLKAMTTRLDEQTAADRKAFADQRLLIENVAEGMRILREKSDDTNVRLSTVAQELEAVRQAVSSMPASVASVPGQDPGGSSADGALPNGTAGAQALPPSSGPAPLISPQKMFDNAYSDYMAGHYDIAVIGFTTFINSFPRSDKVDDAQLNIGQSLYGAGQYREAAEAFQKVVTTYPQSDSAPVAYYKLGLTFEHLKQADAARTAFDTLMQKYPNAYEAILAKQRLDAVKR